MPDPEPTPERDHEDRTDWLILDLLIDADSQRPRSVEEIIREHGHEQNAVDALNRLYGDGLIHGIQDGFVWATRAAIRYSQIAG